MVCLFRERQSEKLISDSKRKTKTKKRVTDSSLKSFLSAESLMPANQEIESANEEGNSFCLRTFSKPPPIIY